MFGSLATFVAVAGLAASPPPGLGIAGDPPDRSGWVTAVEPKPLSENVGRGLKWLVEHQHASGGWAQGEESQAMRGRGDLSAQSNVGDTAAATLAFIRSGSTPSEGPYAGAIFKALGFIMGHIEKSDHESISVTDVKGTRLQAKLGPNIDTFLASLVLSEAAGHMPDVESENRLAAALDKVIYKIQENQRGDGMWGMQGWAPALADAMAAKSLNRALQAGANVDVRALAMAQENVSGEVAAGRATAGKGSAGVALYAGAKNLGILQDSVNSNRKRRAELVEIARSAEDPEQRDQARQELVRIDETESAYDAAQQAIIERLDDEQFIAGFGSNGGEEFLSHMNIGESLVVKGGEAWEKWDAEMTANMNRIQNTDGSWTGHHCITGRTFCTATALMVLMVDRTPVPPEALAEPGEVEIPQPPMEQ
jgi:hypothetical protein